MDGATPDFTPHGKHLIAGAWVAAAEKFQPAPAHGPAHSFAAGTPELIDAAVKSAEEAFWTYGYSSRAGRCIFERHRG